MNIRPASSDDCAALTAIDAAGNPRLGRSGSFSKR